MYRATVVAVTVAGVWVEVPDLVPGFTFGPCERIGDAPTEGSTVLVADVGDHQSPDLIVIGVLE